MEDDMRNGFRVFDTHTHIGLARHSGRCFSADQMLANMDAHGIDRSMLIPFPVVEDYRASHDEIGNAVREHPDRFVGSACLNPFVPEDEYRQEMRRCAEVWGFRAIKLQPQYQALNPLSSRSDFLFEAALEHHMAVIVHTGAGVPFALPALYIFPARKFPDLPIVLGHAGAGIFTGEAIVAASVCSNIYIELSTLMPHHILEVLNHIEPQRLMAGSDLPESVDTEISKILGLSVSDEVKRKILWDVPVAVFG
jgi:predicted TIM-barrel fold metal-dependent hydrolase